MKDLLNLRTLQLCCCRSASPGRVARLPQSAALLSLCVPQAGRLRDFVGDAKLCRKRLKRLISGGVALPSQRMEAHRIIVSSLLRSGADADEAQASAVQHHVNEWLALTAPEYMAGTLRECTHWLRDRLHLDRFRMALLEASVAAAARVPLFSHKFCVLPVPGMVQTRDGGGC